MNRLLQFLATHGSEGTQKFVQRYAERGEALHDQAHALSEFQRDYARAMKSSDPELIKKVISAGERASGTYQKETSAGMSQLNKKLKQLEPGNRSSPNI